MKTLCTLSVLAALLLIAPSSVLADEKDAPISMDVEDMDVRMVIKMIATTGRLNVVVSPAVKGTVTLSVKEVPARAVLEQVAATLNLTLSQADGGPIHIEPTKLVPVTIKVKHETRRRTDLVDLETKLAFLSARLDEARLNLKVATHAAVPAEIEARQKEVAQLSVEIVKTQREIEKIKGKKKDPSSAAATARLAGEMTGAALKAFRARLAEIEAQKKKALRLRGRVVDGKGQPVAGAGGLEDKPAADDAGIVTTVYDVGDLLKLGWGERLITTVGKVMPLASWGLKRNVLEVQATASEQARLVVALAELRAHAGRRAGAQGESLTQRRLRIAAARLVEARSVLAKQKDLPFMEGTPLLDAQRDLRLALVEAQRQVAVLRDHIGQRGKQGPTDEHAQAATQLESRSRKLLERALALRAGKSDSPFSSGRAGGRKTASKAGTKTVTKTGHYEVRGLAPGTYSFGVKLRDENQARALKRYNDLKAAAGHLEAAGLHAEARKFYAQARAAYAESQRSYTRGHGGDDLLPAINALRRDVGALRNEVKELTALVQKLLKQPGWNSSIGIGGASGHSFRGRGGSRIKAGGGAGGGSGGGAPGQPGGSGEGTKER